MNFSSFLMIACGALAEYFFVVWGVHPLLAAVIFP
jgi:hypothetical protein